MIDDHCHSCGITAWALSGMVLIETGISCCPTCATLIRLGIINTDGEVIAHVPYAKNAGHAGEADSLTLIG